MTKLARVQSKFRLHRDVDVVRARQAAIAIARAQLFEETDQARVDLIVAELATNVVRHAGSGEIVISVAEGQDDTIVIECIDEGPGMDAPSSGQGGLGLGLAVVHELGEGAEIRSQVGRGTWIRSRVTRRSR